MIALAPSLPTWSAAVFSTSTFSFILERSINYTFRLWRKKKGENGATFYVFSCKINRVVLRATRKFH